LLDEPTTGLDPKTRKDLWDIIRGLVRGGTSILLTTQYLEEADELADMIAVMDDGKIIAQGTSDDLKAQMGGDIVELTLTGPSYMATVREAVKPFAKSEVTFDASTLVMRVPVREGSKSLMKVVQALNDAKLDIDELSLHRPSLDDVFLALTGDKARSNDLPIAKRGRH